MTVPRRHLAALVWYVGVLLPLAAVSCWTWALMSYSLEPKVDSTRALVALLADVGLLAVARSSAAYDRGVQRAGLVNGHNNNGRLTVVAALCVAVCGSAVVTASRGATHTPALIIVGGLSLLAVAILLARVKDGWLMPLALVLGVVLLAVGVVRDLMAA